MSPGSFFLIVPGLEMNLGQYSGTHNPTQIVWSVADGDDDVDDGNATKSYTCAFCKRGFSNAQALGGHMNIHRKDRAKLKEAAEDHYHNQTLLSLDISNSSPPPPIKDVTAASSSSSPSPPPSILVQGEDSLVSRDTQLRAPLFVDQPVVEKEREQLLDLELRLGPERPPPPASTSSPGKSTRGFP